MSERCAALITGITGQDGSHLAELLLDRGVALGPSTSKIVDGQQRPIRVSRGEANRHAGGDEPRAAVTSTRI
jgi:GDP-D-mannose dehydratase